MRATAVCAEAAYVRGTVEEAGKAPSCITCSDGCFFFLVVRGGKMESETHSGQMSAPKLSKSSAIWQSRPTLSDATAAKAALMSFKSLFSI